ncbi:MAG: hypothetical protein U9Q29_06565 [Campylobacterota bacterium]|nr:hypothetical protein [Campylobacterota bacterium]
MSEPRLEDISDYDTLKGEKKRVVLAVILSGLLLGVIYLVINSVFDSDADRVAIEKTLKKVPVK